MAVTYRSPLVRQLEAVGGRAARELALQSNDELSSPAAGRASITKVCSTWYEREFVHLVDRSAIDDDAVPLALGGPRLVLAAEDRPGAPAGYPVSLEQLQEAVGKRFPRRYPVQGILDLDLQTPRLH